MKKYFVQALLFTTLVVATSCGSNSETSETSTSDGDTSTISSGTAGDASVENSMQATDGLENDSTFAITAASGGLMEVELGKLAQTKASAAEVKNFGSKMVTDHTKANNELKSIAAAKNITLPTAPASKHQEHINELQGKSGAEFDKAYMDLMVEDHEEDVNAFEKQANNGTDPELKAFAAKTLPVLKMHHEMAKTIHGKMKQ